MKTVLRKLLCVMLVLFLLVAPMYFPAFADEGDVCEISGATYATLDEALFAVEDGQTIKLLDDINYDGGIVIENKSITFDLNGFDLNVVNPLTEGSDVDRTGLYVEGNTGNAAVALEGEGEFNVTGNKYGVFVNFVGSVGMNAEATVTNAYATGNEGCAAYAYGENAELTVKGNATATGVGGIGATAESEGLVTIKGNVTATADDTFTGDYDYCAAVEAWDDGEVIVEGDVNATGDDSIGVRAADSYVIVEGDVTGDLGGAYATASANIRITGDVSSTGPLGFGVQASDGCDIDIGGNVISDDVGAWIIMGSEGDLPSNITIDGIINAPNYIHIGGNEFSFVEGSSYEGSLIYNDEYGNRVAVAEFAGGSGYEDDPFLVAHSYHLYNVRNHLDKCFRQTEDINLNYFISGDGWEPIGDSIYNFTGTYDGNEKTISNLFINRDDTDKVGLFGVVKEDAEIRDLVLEDVDVIGRHYVGGLAGWNDGLIENLSVTGDVSGDDDVGGIAGQNEDGSITGSYFEGTVTGNDYVGGLVGDNNGGITNCHTDVTVTGGGDYIGGLTGWNAGLITGSYSSGAVNGNNYVGGLVGCNVGTEGENGEIEASYSTCEVEGNNMVGGLVGSNNGPVIDSYASGTVNGNWNVGGLAGWNDSTGDENGEIETSFSTGTVEGNYYVGGLVGWNQGPVTDSYATGTVNGSNDFVGGLAGSNDDSIANCYSIGAVTGDHDVGGLVGSLNSESGTVANSYWDTETSGLGTSDGGEGKSTSAMKQQETFFDWDFGTIWAINDSDNNGYPFLIWQGTEPPQTYALIITAGTGGSITAGDSGDYAEGTVINIVAAPSPKYRFNEWSSDGGGILSSTTSNSITFTMPANAVTITASFTYIGGGGGGGGGGGSGTPTKPSTPIYSADVKMENGTETTLAVEVNKGDRTASINTGTQSFAQGRTVITMPPIPDIDTYLVGIPVPELSTIDVQGTLTLNTEMGSITVPSNMLTGVADTDGNMAQITIGQGDKSTLPEDVRDAIGDRPLIQLTISIDGKRIDWRNTNAPVTVSISYTPIAAELANPESIVIWYIDGSGNVGSVPNGRYDSATGMITFTTTHFDNYAVVYNKVTFNDVPASAWYHKAVSFIAARGITSGTGNGNYSPEAKLTRGQFIVMLMKAYEIAPDADSENNFADAGATYYTGYLAAAKRLSISSGVGNNMFAPDKEITRQEMFTLLYNALKCIGRLPEGTAGKPLSAFADAGDISSWAKEAMTLLVKTGIIVGNDGKLSPLSTTTRAEMAQVLYNMLSK